MHNSLANLPIKVLLVEDDEDDAIITRALLDQISGQLFEIEWTHSFDAGLARIKDHNHDIGLLDYNLGTKTGIDFLRETHFDQEQTPIIILTGQGNESLVLQVLEAGAIDYIPKHNISSENLQRTIIRGMDKIRLQSELTAYLRQLENTTTVLKQRTDEIQRFYHLSAHELKTPLAAASELVSILLEGIPGSLNSEQKDHLHLIQGCCDHSDRHMNNLYEITLLETGKLRLNQQPADLGPLVTDVLYYFAPLAQAKHITLDAYLAPKLPYVMMDVQRIRQVLLNLIGNALTFTQKAGTIFVVAGEDPLCPGRVRVAIQDTGIGIPQDQLNCIFEPLYQVQQSPAATPPGLGLGLFISRELIKLHEGTISLTSTGGQGSTFSFTLRCAG
ncbi:MAG: hybrid sensor histidine kinase/response regulator [Nitrospirales bacterium]